MSEPANPVSATAYPSADATAVADSFDSSGAPQRNERHRTSLVSDLVIILGGCLLAGVLGGVVWNWLAPRAYYVRAARGAGMYEDQMAARINADGVFMVIGLILGIILGIGVCRYRESRPLVNLLLVVAGSIAAGVVTLGIGQQLGHVSVASRVDSTPVGGHIAASLGVASHWVVAAWPLGVLLAATLVLNVLPARTGAAKNS